jgi:hypothetical protein
MQSLWLLSKKLIHRFSREDVSSSGIATRDLSFITLPWGTVQTYFYIFSKASQMLILVTSGGGHPSPGLLSTAHWL